VIVLKAELTDAQNQMENEIFFKKRVHTLRTFNKKIRETPDKMKA
jgi:hypothetical protein